MLFSQRTFFTTCISWRRSNAQHSSHCRYHGFCSIAPSVTIIVKYLYLLLYSYLLLYHCCEYTSMCKPQQQQYKRIPWYLVIVHLARTVAATHDMNHHYYALRRRGGRRGSHHGRFSLVGGSNVQELHFEGGLPELDYILWWEMEYVHHCCAKRSLAERHGAHEQRISTPEPCVKDSRFFGDSSFSPPVIRNAPCPRGIKLRAN